MEQTERIADLQPRPPNGKYHESALDMSAGDRSDVGCRASGRTLIQTVNGCSELPDDPALISFHDPPKDEAWQLVLHRLRVENAALANVAAVAKKIVKVREPEPAEQPQYLKLKAAAKLIGLSARKLRLLTQLGEIDRVPGNKELGEGRTTPWLYDRADLLNYMAKRKARF